MPLTCFSVRSSARQSKGSSANSSRSRSIMQRMRRGQAWASVTSPPCALFFVWRKLIFLHAAKLFLVHICARPPHTHTLYLGAAEFLTTPRAECIISTDAASPPPQSVVNKFRYITPGEISYYNLSLSACALLSLTHFHTAFASAPADAHN
jgi:hypothetical protein